MWQIFEKAGIDIEYLRIRRIIDVINVEDLYDVLNINVDLWLPCSQFSTYKIRPKKGH